MVDPRHRGGADQRKWLVHRPRAHPDLERRAGCTVEGHAGGRRQPAAVPIGKQMNATAGQQMTRGRLFCVFRNTTSRRELEAHTISRRRQPRRTGIRLQDLIAALEHLPAALRAEADVAGVKSNGGGEGGRARREKTVVFDVGSAHAERGGSLCVGWWCETEGAAQQQQRAAAAQQARGGVTVCVCAGRCCRCLYRARPLHRPCRPRPAAVRRSRTRARHPARSRARRCGGKRRNRHHPH